MRLAAAAAALMVSACNLADRQRDASGNNAVQPAANEALPRGLQAANSAAPADDPSNAQLALAPSPRRDPSGVDREWFAGLWTDTGDCADAGQFGRDGRYRLADGTRGMWNVQGGRLVIENGGGRNIVRLRKVAEDAVETINAQGQASRSTRCARITQRAPPEELPKPVAPPPPADIAD